MKLYNSLTRKIEDFKPINPPSVGVYTCGPTVYNYATIGNWRTYLLSDFLIRTLKYLGFNPKHVMNITDVGHLAGDGDLGVDKVEKAARRVGKTAWEIAAFYTKDFLEGIRKLNLIKPDILPKATDHIGEQINLIKAIERKGLTYKISDGIYFDVLSFEKKGAKYGALSTLDRIKEGARVKRNLEKRDARDFALWKFSPKDVKRHMEWESPWGKGFPGWHIECSAMSMKYLGEQFDIHLGGEDLRSTHHPNEIAQSEAATGKKPFVKYWMHGAFLKIDKKKMSKSLGNLYTLADLERNSFNALDFRYLCLMTHYRKSLNFTWDGMKASQKSLARLRDFISLPSGPSVSKDLSKYRKDFITAISDDLNLAKSLAVVWSLVGAANGGEVKKSEAIAQILDFDQVLGLELRKKEEVEYPEKIRKLLRDRQKAKDIQDYSQADKIRSKIESYNYRVIDTVGSTKLIPNN